MGKIVYLEDMYQDDFFPDFLVKKIENVLKQVVTLLESGDYTSATLQETLDKATIQINYIDEEFYENDSEIETVARESIAATVEQILHYYHIDLDVEDAIRKRDW